MCIQQRGRRKINQKDRESSEERVWSASLLSADVTALFQHKKLRWPRVWPDTCWFYRAHWNSLRWLQLSWWKWSPLKWEELLVWACLIQAGSVQLLAVWWANQWHCSYPGGLWFPGACQLSACGPHIGAIWEYRQRQECHSVAVPKLGSAQVAASRAGSSSRWEGACPAAPLWALSQLAEPQPAQVQLQEAHV